MRRKHKRQEGDSHEKRPELTHTTGEEEEEKKKSGWKRFFYGVGKGIKILFVSFWMSFLSFLVVVTILGFSLYLSYKHSFATAKIRNNATQTVFYDKNGDVIYESFGARKPDPVELSDVPEVVKNATLASEDAGFYSHGAIDKKGIGRAAVNNIKNSKKSSLAKVTDLFSEENYTEGGSTITQQLVKNIYLSNERSFDRKFKEVIYSIELEKKWSKDKIFEEYLNNVYYGEQSLGIKNAAKNYFDKEVSELTLAEASMLAGLPTAPTKLSPVSGDFEQSKKRQEYVLSKMVNLGMVSFDEAKEAVNLPLEFSNKKAGLVNKYPYFVDFVKQEVSSKLGEEALSAGGLSIYATLDPKSQDLAEEKARQYLDKFKYRKVTNASVVVLDNENETVSALVGGADWEESKVNVATSERQPGSSFKPIVYTAGLLSGYTASSQLLDTYVNFGGNPPYIPRNYNGGYSGNVTVRKALANSLNIPAVEMTKLTGIEKVIDTAEKMGITSIDKDPDSYGLSIGLGSAEVELFELTRAYSVFANSGGLATFSGIDRVVDNEGTEIYMPKKLKEEAIDPKVAYIMASILSDNKSRSMVFGTNSPLYLKDRPVAAKTGTTDNYTDSWTLGFTPQNTVGVWMGNNDRSKMSYLPGIEGAAYIWHDIIEGISKNLPPKEFKRPEGLVELAINPYTGAVTTATRWTQTEYFVPGTEPKDKPDLSYLNQFRSSYRTTR